MGVWEWKMVSKMIIIKQKVLSFCKLSGISKGVKMFLNRELTKA